MIDLNKLRNFNKLSKEEQEPFNKEATDQLEAAFTEAAIKSKTEGGGAAFQALYNILLHTPPKDFQGLLYCAVEQKAKDSRANMVLYVAVGAFLAGSIFGQDVTLACIKSELEARQEPDELKDLIDPIPN